MSETTTDSEFPNNNMSLNTQSEKHSISFWENFDTKYLRHSSSVSTTLFLAYSLIFFTGVLGNSMVILVVAKRKQMQTVTNIFVMNLAVADLLVIIFCVPATLLANLIQPWILGTTMCKAVPYIQGVAVCASAYSIVVISVDRCKAVYQPLKHRIGLTRSQVVCCIAFIWITALLFTLPWALIFDVVTMPEDGLSYCVENWKSEIYGNMYYLFVNLICYYVIPLIVILCSNACIWWKVSRRIVPSVTACWDDVKLIQSRTKHCVRKRLSIVSITYLSSWLPLYILVTGMRFTKNKTETQESLLETFLPFAQLLGSWNSCINPVLYAFLNKKFREMFKRLLPKWSCFGRNSVDGIMTPPVNTNSLLLNMSRIQLPQDSVWSRQDLTKDHILNEHQISSCKTLPPPVIINNTDKRLAKNDTILVTNILTPTSSFRHLKSCSFV